MVPGPSIGGNDWLGRPLADFVLAAGKSAKARNGGMA